MQGGRAGWLVLALSMGLLWGSGCKTNKNQVEDPPPGPILDAPREDLVDQVAYDDALARGGQAMADEDWANAVRFYKDAVEISPTAWEPHVDLAVAYAKTPDFIAAIRQIDLAIEKGGGEDARTWYNLGNIYQNRGLYAESIEAYRVALGLGDPADVDTLINLASGYIFVRQYDEAKATLDHLLTIAPNDARVFHNLALILHLKKDYQNALNAYDEALAVDPNFSQSHFNRGDVLSHMERWSESVQAYERYLAVDPEGPYATQARNRAETGRNKLR